jgi:hypothetical protein
VKWASAAAAVLLGAGAVAGSALARSTHGEATPSSSFAGKPSGAGPSSSFSGSGTLGRSGEGDDGGEGSGSFEGEGRGSGTIGIGVSNPNGMPVAAVRRVQTRLARLGYFHHVVTGYYGPVTIAAVKRFQLASGLKPDGIWGPLSESALNGRLAR